MESNLIAISFEESSKAYQALSELKQLGVGGDLKVVNAAVVERGADGRFALKDGATDGSAGDAVLTGTLLGSLIGILAGPLGVLLGGVTGAVIGSSSAVGTAATRYSLLEQLMQSIPPGATALVATVDEPAGSAIDQLATRLDGHVLRRPVAAVQEEVDANEEAAEAAAKEARKVLRERQKEEWHEKFDNWKEEAGNKLDELRNKIKAKFGDK